uniref:Sorbitol dehydrogenase n=1 Tax=Photinus pyralis TaxID=7054 RepID=A0A1Y1LBP2_PHOPY
MDLGDNWAVVFYGVNDLRLEQRSIPKPSDDEVLVKMHSVGICGSDVHQINNGCIGFYVVRPPMILGHEGSGTVVEVGKNVTHLKHGDRVVLDILPRCQKCTYCQAGRYNLCTHPTLGLKTQREGCMAHYYAHPANFCYKLPTEMSLEEAAVVEPLAIGLYACRRGNVRPGSVVLIIGAGSVGLLTLATSKACGATKVIITDVSQWRLDKAKELGADFTLKVEPNDQEDGIVRRITSLLDDRPTVSFDCAGFQSTARVAVKATASGGTVVLVGISGRIDMELPVRDILTREVDVRGCYACVNDFKTAMEMVATGKANVKTLVTHHYQMSDITKAFDELRTGRAIKVLIHPN